MYIRLSRFFVVAGGRCHADDDNIIGMYSYWVLIGRLRISIDWRDADDN